VLVAAHTYAFRDRPLADALDEIAALGFGAVEVWAGHVQEPPGTVAAAIAARGLAVAAVGAGGFYTADPAEPDRVFALAKTLGAPTVVACLAPAHAAAVARRRPPSVALCVENHWDQALARPKPVRSLLDTVPALWACLDTGHALAASTRPEAFVRSLAFSLRHVHLKDAALPGLVDRLLGPKARRRLERRPAPVFPGDGDLDVATFVASLRHAPLARTITVEHEGQDAAAALTELGRRLEAAGVPAFVRPRRLRLVGSGS
jgi:sugar phosphate isomerase/epimerase